MKTKKIITIVITSLAVAIVLLSGLMKLLSTDQIVATLTKVGVVQYITALGLMEITFAALFVYSKTIRIGFILLSCYFAGALATELHMLLPLTP